MTSLQLRDANRFVLAKQHLCPHLSEIDILGVVKDIVGLHATCVDTPYYSLYARIQRFKRIHLDELLFERHDILKFRCMRRTIYILTHELLKVAYAATNARVTRGWEKNLAQYGMDSGLLPAITESVVRVLTGKELSTREIKREMDTAVYLNAVLSVLSDNATILRTRRGKYKVFDEVVPDLGLGQLEEEKALPLLVERYIGAYGPVT